MLSVMPHPGGRPSKLDKCAARFLKHIASGQSIVGAAALSGLAESTVHTWLANGRKSQTGKFAEFLKSFTRAKGQREAAMVAEIRAAGAQDWRAVSWLLERLHPEQFSVKAQEVSVSVNATANANPPALNHEQMRARIIAASEFVDRYLKETNGR